MNREELFQDITRLPPAARQEAVDFIAFLKLRYRPHPIREADSASSPLEKEAFIGMWKDRHELADSATWVKDLRRREWG